MITNGCDGNGSIGDVGYTGKIRKWDAFNGTLLPTHYSTGWASTLPYDILLIDDPVGGPSADLMVTLHTDRKDPSRCLLSMDARTIPSVC